MPNPPYLHADTLFTALKKMSDNKMFKELTFYVEACESGSMFEQYSDQLKQMNIYVTTAANPSESSWERIARHKIRSMVRTCTLALATCTLLTGWKMRILRI